MSDKLKDSGYTKIECRVCGTLRFVENKQYKNGFPDTCIACGKR